MDKIEKIKAEIERLMNRYDSEYDKDESEVKAAKGNVCHEILCFIDSLPEEPVKSLDVDEIKLILDINSDMQEELENSTMFPPEWAGTEKYYEELLKRYESRR